MILKISLLRVVTHLKTISTHFCIFSMYITMPLPLVAKIEVHSTTGDALPPAACLEGYRAPESHMENVPAMCGCLRHTREPQMAQDIHV